MSVAANQLTKRQETRVVSMPVAASTHLYEGTMAFTNSTGFADDDTASGANSFAGITRSEVDNSSGSAGDLSVELETEGIFELVGSGFTQADVDKPIFASDNFTITLTGAGNTFIGIVATYVSTTKLGVRLIDRSKLVGAAAQAAVATTGATNSSPYGFTAAAQPDALVALVNAMRLALVNAGLMKGAA